jgi:hypothetical protein
MAYPNFGLAGLLRNAPTKLGGINHDPLPWWKSHEDVSFDTENGMAQEDHASPLKHWLGASSTERPLPASDVATPPMSTMSQ